MIGYYINNNYIADSEGNVASGLKSLQVLDYMIKDSLEPAIMYDLDACVASLLAQIGLTLNEAECLLKNNRVQIAGYTLKYYHSKLFCIDYGIGHGKKFRNFFNAKQFGCCRLDDYDKQQGVEMAKRAAKIAEDTIEGLKVLDLPYYKLTSPVSLYLKSSKGKALNFPTIDDLPELEIGELAYESLRGNWLEAYKAGYWDNAYDYDINGAYAAEIASLPDLRLGDWINSTDIPEFARLGFAKGLLNITSDFHPFVIKTQNGENLLPVGEDIEQTLALNKIKLLQQYPEVGTFEIQNGWWWIPNKPLQYPFKKEMQRLYDLRQQYYNTKAGTMLHRIMAGLWGKLLEFHNNKLGENFNPVYGATVESNVACKVFSSCKTNGVVPLHVAVDGIVTDKPLKLNISNKLGDWRLSHKGKCIIINAGTVGFEGKNGKEEFSITYEWLYNAFNANPHLSEYTMQKNTFVSLRKAVKQNRLADIGKIEKLNRTVYANEGNRRLWDDSFSCGTDVLTKQISSVALPYNSIVKLQNTIEEDFRIWGAM